MFEIMLGLAFGLLVPKWNIRIALLPIAIGLLVVWANPGNSQVFDWFNRMTGEQIGNTMVNECYGIVAGIIIRTFFKGWKGNN